MPRGGRRRRFLSVSSFFALCVPLGEALAFCSFGATKKGGCHSSTLFSSVRTRRTLLGSSRENGGNGGGNGNDGERTLYDILNASPDDSYQTLRQRYTDAARRAHPDAIAARKVEGGGNAAKDEDEEEDFREIAAAWRILSDPKERRKYDRELKAKEFASGVGEWIETGMSAAAPFLFETAPTQIERTASDLGKTAKEVGRTVQDVGERLDRARSDAERRLERARRIAELGRKGAELERRAERETRRAEEMRERRWSDRRLDKLRRRDGGASVGSAEGQQLTSADADRILKSFQFLDYRTNGADSSPSEARGFKKEDRSSSSGAHKPHVSASLDAVDALAKVEGIYDREQRVLQDSTTDLISAERTADAAREEERAATKRLEAARVRLNKLRFFRNACEEDRSLALQKEEEATVELRDADESLEAARTEEQLAKARLEEAQRLFREAQASREGRERARSGAAQRVRAATTESAAATKKVDLALRDESAAEDRLGRTERDAEVAGSALEESEESHADAARRQREAASKLDGAAKDLGRAREEVRAALRRTEEQNLKEEDRYLKEESGKLEVLARDLFAEAVQLRRRAEELRQAADDDDV